MVLWNINVVVLEGVLISQAVNVVSHEDSDSKEQSVFKRA